VVIAVMIVVVIIPIAIRMPTTAVLIPPAVCVRPAVLTRLVQLLARVDRLPAIPTMMVYGNVQPMVGFCDATLACPFIRSNRRYANENKSTCQRHGRKHRLSPK
jgi:hypothetical protein